MMRIAIAVVVLLVAGVSGYWGYKTLVGDHVAQVKQGYLQQDKQIEALKALGVQVPTAPVADKDVFETLATAMSEIVTISYGGFESDGGGVFATDVVVTLTVNKEVGVRIDELRIWGADAVVFSTLGSGNSDASVRIADRIDLRGLTYFGLDQITEKFMDSYIDTVGDITAEAIGEETETALNEVLDYDFQKYDIKMDRTFVDGLTLYTTDVLAGQKANDDNKAFMTYVQDWAKFARSVSFEASASYGAAMTMDYALDGQKTSMTMSMPFAAIKGVRRGDIDFNVATDIVFDMNFEIPISEFVTDGSEVVTDPEDPPFEMALKGGIETYTLEGMRFAKLLDYLARGEMPPTSEVDLMSLGTLRILGENYGFGKESIYRVEETIIDLSNFHWFIPTKFRAKSNGIMYDIEGVLEWVEGIAAVTSDSDDAETREMMQKSALFLKEQGLSKLHFDMDFGGVWDAETGAGKADYYLDFKDFSRLSIEGAGAILDFDSLAALIPADGEAFDETAAVRVFNDANFSDFSLVITDNGGIDRSFAMAVAFADLAPEGDPSMQFLKGANVGDLKVSSAAMIRLSSGQMAQVFPPAGPYLQSLADFIQKGGALRVSMTPETPVLFTDLDSFATQEPAAIVKRLGLTVEQTSSKEINRNN